MNGRRIRTAVLVGVLAAAAIAVALVVFGRGGGESVPTGPKTHAIEARGVFTPSNALFGDTVTASVEVTLDRRRIDPDSVAVRTDFAPWRAIVPPRRIRRDGETTTYFRTTYVIRCLDRSCLPSKDAAVQEFVPARVTYRSLGAPPNSRPSTVKMEWPVLVVASRYATSASQGPANAGRWRIDLLSLPPVSYGLSPKVVFLLLLGGAILLVLAGWKLVALVFPRRAVPVESEEPAESPLTPLERALVLLDDTTRVNGAGDQRRALEFVALELVARGDLPLAEAARALAWSQPTPEIEMTHGIAVRARSALGEPEHEDLP